MSRTAENEGRSCAHDRGSVLILGICLVAVCLLGVLVAVDACAAFLKRSALLAVADSAALAGAQAIDIGAYYANGASQGTRLDPVDVAVAARRQVQRAENASQITVEAIDTDGQTVRVRLREPLHLPFLRTALGDVVRVEATARLDYRLDAQANQ